MLVTNKFKNKLKIVCICCNLLYLCIVFNCKAIIIKQCNYNYLDYRIHKTINLKNRN